MNEYLILIPLSFCQSLELLLDASRINTGREKYTMLTENVTIKAVNTLSTRKQ